MNNPQSGHAMSVEEAIIGRSSAKKFSDEVPSRDIVNQILLAGSRAPDHGLLAPWRFTVLTGESRGLLGNAMRSALSERMPEADDEALGRERSKAFRSPILIVVAAVATPHPKVPEIEQWVAVGAAIQNMWLRARELGLGMAWKTGSHAYHGGVKAALGIGAEDQIIGFLHLGYATSAAPVREGDYLSRTRWFGE
ncbi:MAG: nitroreductase family protein [Steroidobacteraceae bacterium]|jgi:nitroreductase